MLQSRIKGDFTLLVIVTGKIAVETLEDKITVTQWFGIERFVGQIDINNLKEERAAQGLIELLQDHAPTGINRSGGVELTQPLLVGMKGMTQTFVLCFRQGQAGMVADKEDLLSIQYPIGQYGQEIEVAIQQKALGVRVDLADTHQAGGQVNVHISPMNHIGLLLERDLHLTPLTDKHTATICIRENLPFGKERFAALDNIGHPERK